MESRILGFIGSDKYDIILYLSQILRTLEYKVLIVDCSESKALTFCIPEPKIDKSAVLYMREAVQEEKSYYITHQGCEFIRNLSYEQIMEKRKEYDYIMIDFGFHQEERMLAACSLVVLCVDQQLQNMIALQPVFQEREELLEKSCLIFRRIYGCKISMKYLQQELGMTLPRERVYQYDQDVIDIKYCIDSQYNHRIQMSFLPKGMKSCLSFLMQIIEPKLSREQEKKIYKVCRVKVEGIQHTLVST